MFADAATFVGGWSQVILALGVLGAAALGLHRYIRKNLTVPLKAVPGLVDDVKDIQEKALVVATKVINLEEQMVPNHGTSLRDSNDRTEVLIRAIAEHVGIDADLIVQTQTPPAKEIP